MYHPRDLTEPLTGFRFIARSRGAAALRWVPLGLALAMFAVGFYAGKLVERLS